MLTFDENPHNDEDLKRGSDALLGALMEYSSSRVPQELTNRFVKAWRCHKCLASGEVHSISRKAMITAIRNQHQLRRLAANCQFDHEAIFIAPISPASPPIPLSPLPVVLA